MNTYVIPIIELDPNNLVGNSLAYETYPAPI